MSINMVQHEHSWEYPPCVKQNVKTLKNQMKHTFTRKGAANTYLGMTKYKDTANLSFLKAISKLLYHLDK